MLLSDCTPRDPAALVLLNGPCIGHTAEGAMDAMDFMGCEYHEIWVNYNDLTGIMVSKGNHPQMALIQVSEIL